jgi:cyanophycinase
MLDVDRALLATLGGPAQARVVVLPTASGLEPGMPQQWNARGVAHFTALGATVTAVPLVTRDDASAQPVLDALRQANFFYLSGGNPQYAIATWRDTPAWRILADRFENGAVVAGCSAGAMMLGASTISVRGMLAGQAPTWEPALGLLPGTVTLPHFDRTRHFLDDQRFDEMLANAPQNIVVVGVDEDTALIRFGDYWQVLGQQSATVFAKTQGTRYPSGARVPLPLTDSNQSSP